MENDRIDEVIKYITHCLDGNMDGHGVDHSLRVYKNVMKLLPDFPDADAELCSVAGLVHDVIDEKVTADIVLAKAGLANFLATLNYSNDFIEQVLFISENMSFREAKHGIFNQMIEGQIVQDADRLDAVGAIAVIRTAMYGAVNARPTIYIEGDTSNDTMIGHFHAKLYKLADLMNTEKARELAIERIEFMKGFEAQLIAEIR